MLLNRRVAVSSLVAFVPRGTGHEYLLLSRSWHEKTIYRASDVKLVLCGQGKGLRGRYPAGGPRQPEHWQNRDILCKCQLVTAARPVAIRRSCDALQIQSQVQESLWRLDSPSFSTSGDCKNSSQVIKRRGAHWHRRTVTKKTEPFEPSVQILALCLAVCFTSNVQNLTRTAFKFKFHSSWPTLNQLLHLLQAPTVTLMTSTLSHQVVVRFLT